MSKELEKRVQALYGATKELQSLKEIQPHCDDFNSWLSEQNYSDKSLGTLLSRAGLYRLFKQVPLQQDKNAVLVPKHDAEGNVKGHELKHYVSHLCGLKKEQWDKRNETSRVTERLENSQQVDPIDPDLYIKVTGDLLSSDEPSELAVGLIAATGRRPHEILARAKFKAVPNNPYRVSFEGQGKKRGEKPVFEIDTLFPADYIIKCLNRLRKDNAIASMLKEVEGLYPGSVTKQNVVIDSRRNSALNNIVRRYFGDKGDKAPVLSFRHGEEQDNNKALRAACAVLLTERECQGMGYGAKILYASKFLGHISKDVSSDRNLSHLVTTAGYSDYSVSKPVPYPQALEEKIGNVKLRASLIPRVKDLQNLWGCRQHEAVERLLESGEEVIKLQRQLLEAQSRIAQLENQLQENTPMFQPEVKAEVKEPVTATEPNQLELRIERLESLVTSLVEGLGNKESKVVGEIRVQEPTARATTKADDTDWSQVSSDELRKYKSSASVEEKLNRVFQAIANHNDNIAPSNNERWYIGNVTLRDLSGCNGQVVADWIDRHRVLVDDHNNKYKLGQYHNKRHKGQSASDVITW
jgi:Telomere resolvase